MKIKILGAVSVLALMVAVTAYTEANAGSATDAKADTSIGLSAETKAELKADWEQTKDAVQEKSAEISAAADARYEDIKARLIDEDAATPDSRMTISSGITAKGLLGQPIQNTHDKKVGTVKDIILDSEGDAEFIVVSDGGFMGVGDKLAAFDYNLVMRQEENGDVVMPLSDELIKNVAEFSYDPKEAGDKVQVIPANGYSVSELLKGQLVNPSNETLGTIENIAFRQGEAAEVIVSFDQKLGIGGERAAFDFDDLTLSKGADGNLNFRMNAYQSAKFEEMKKTNTTTN